MNRTIKESISLYLIPFYSKKERGRQEYTLFWDKKKDKLYKAYHKEMKQSTYWIAFALTLIFMRSIDDIHMSIFKSLGLLFLLGIIGTIVGLFYHRKMLYEELIEIFLTQAQLEKYIIAGKKSLRKELETTFILLFFFIVLFTFFFVTKWLPWLIFAFVAFVLMIILLCRFPIERFKLIKRGKNKWKYYQ